MNVFLVAVGVFFLVCSVYPYTRPMDVRSLPPPREWQQTPRQAEETQREYAFALAVSLTILGVLSLAAGLLMG
ncbi:hypothetical protein [Halobacterium jilantaiense]|uniref:Uncharacterized protein n=1 Tax=Halobacterium jilantaiense TaxID=355548 RepID=A0A1I0QI11_9EURY|nr:hypothetical protein [Halobacterium jilantaiense]SEW26277.1 hypothetical protein SAMN04487945_2599 [Halobacterium jilantaiense]